jgi:hypothetical protein
MQMKWIYIMCDYAEYERQYSRSAYNNSVRKQCVCM